MSDRDRADGRAGCYEKMLREHAKLRSLLDDLKQMLSERSDAFADVVSRLATLQALVEEHFRTEEESGCLTELVNRAPHVAVAVESLIVEHGEMVKQISELASWASGREGIAEDWEEAGTRFGVFSQKLREHERVESELLQTVFTEDIGSKD